jgi:hypothetical protein
MMKEFDAESTEGLKQQKGCKAAVVTQLCEVQVVSSAPGTVACASRI